VNSFIPNFVIEQDSRTKVETKEEVGSQGSYLLPWQWWGKTWQ
jgi:hypothetical protein